MNLTTRLRLVDRTLLGLGLTAFLVYLPGLWWGLPYASGAHGARGWDVDSIAGMGPLAEFHNLLMHPDQGWYVAYPLLHYLVLGLCYAPYLGFLWLTGGLAHPSAAYPYGFTDPVSSIAVLALIGRLVSLVMGVGLVLLVCDTARRVWNRDTGILAGLIVLLCTPVFYYARTGNLDVPVLFWTAAGLAVAARVTLEGFTIRRAAGLGALAAAAVATKDQAYGGWVFGLVFLIGLHLSGRLPESRTAGRWTVPVALIASGLVAYAVGNGIVISPNRFRAHVHFLLDYEHTFQNVAKLDITRPKTGVGYLLLSRDMLQAMMASLGLPVLLAGIGGCLYPPGRRPLFVSLLLVMLAGYLLLVIAPISHVRYRYAMFPALVLAFTAAAFFTRDGLTRWRQLRAGFAALGIGWLALMAGNVSYQQLLDARNPAGAWLRRTLTSGDRVAYFGSLGQLPRLPAGIVVVGVDGDSATSWLAADRGRTLVLVIPDYSSWNGLEHSRYLPDSTYAALSSGALGYDRVAYFRTRPLAGWRIDLLPIVNPQVQVFARPGMVADPPVEMLR